MDYKTEYAEFIKWITDPSEMGEMGPVEYTKEEDAFAKLFAAYLNCKHQPAPHNKQMQPPKKAAG